MTTIGSGSLTVTLKTLDEANTELLQRWAMINTPAKNGIACPACGQECQETSNPNQHLKGQPPHWKISCSSCDWTGTRVAC